jgi:hypothetical protein
MKNGWWRAASVCAVLVLVVAGATAFYRLAENTPLGARLFSFSVPLQVNDLSKPGGRLFRARSQDDRFACSAHFVYAVSSRLTTNSNQIEFYCREADRAPDIRFERVSEIDNENISKNNIAYFKGMIIDITNSVAILISGDVVPLSTVDEFKNGKIYYLSRKSNGEYLFFLTNYNRDGEACPDLSIVDDEGAYYGSVRISSYVSYFDGRVLFDLAGDLFATDEIKPQSKCATLNAAKIREGVGWPYGGIRTDKGFLLGGSGVPARLYEVSPDLSTRVIPINAPRDFVTEMYSYVPMRGRTFVGTFPVGHPFSVSGDTKSPATKSDYFPLDERHWTFPKIGAPYRELQSMTRSYGILWGGMFPWGEVVANDRLARALNRYRLFSHPRIDLSQQAPYVAEAARTVSDFWDGRFDAVPEFAAARKSHSRTDELPRELGLYSEAWGQRIQQIVVKNGAICASTGSHGETPYVPSVHTFMNASQYSEYGAVWCASLAGQALAEVESTGSYAATFSVFEKGVTIEIGTQTIESLTTVSPEIGAAFAAAPTIESALPVTFTGE